MVNRVDRLQRRGHGLARFHGAGEHDAVDRRLDRRLRQVGLVGRERRPGIDYLRARRGLVGLAALERRLRGFELGLRGHLAAGQPRDFLQALEIAAAPPSPSPPPAPPWRWPRRAVARERVTWSENFDVSSSTRTCPFFTRSLTSTSTFATVPDSSLPMLTLRVGCSVPLAVTAMLRLPRVTGSVATPFSQLVGIQAVLNVVTGERYGSVPDEVLVYVLGHLGEPPAPIDENVLDRMLATDRGREMQAWEPPQPLDPRARRTQYGDRAMSDERAPAALPRPAPGRRGHARRRTGGAHLSVRGRRDPRVADQRPARRYADRLRRDRSRWVEHHVSALSTGFRVRKGK